MSSGWKKHGIATDKNQVIFVDYQGHVLYYQESTIAEAQRDDFFGKNTAPTLFNSIIVARHIDQLFANPQAPIKEVEALFYTYLKNYDLSLYLLTDRKKFEQEYYALDFKNKKTYLPTENHPRPTDLPMAQSGGKSSKRYSFRPLICQNDRQKTFIATEIIW